MTPLRARRRFRHLADLRMIAGSQSVSASRRAARRGSRPRSRSCRMRSTRTARPMASIPDFGKLAQTRISRENLAALQTKPHPLALRRRRPAPRRRRRPARPRPQGDEPRAGLFGRRPETVDAILALAERGVMPAIPAKGSVGASGDLAPLAHMAATLIGVGEARFEGALMPPATRSRWRAWRRSRSRRRRGWR